MKRKLFTVVGACSLAAILSLPLAKLDGARLDSDEFVDNIVYETPVEASLDCPDQIITPKAKQGAVGEVKTLVLHYYNENGGCNEREFYMWCSVVNGIAFTHETVHTDDKHMSITLDFTSDERLAGFMQSPYYGLIIKKTGTWADQSEDKNIIIAMYQVDDNGKMELWVIPGIGNSLDIVTSEEDTLLPRVKSAYFDKNDWKTINCNADDVPLSYKLYVFDENYYVLPSYTKEATKERYLLKEGVPTSKNFQIKLNYMPRINAYYFVETTYAAKPSKIQACPVFYETLYETPRFESLYTYKEGELGAIYSQEKTTFRLWAPTSTLVKLNIYDTGTPESVKGHAGSDSRKVYKMFYQPGGVWELTVKGDLNGKYYTYTVQNTLGENEVVDPYAHGAGINGARGMVFAPGSTDPEGWNQLPSKWDGDSVYDIKSPQDLAVYEVHVRDLTMGDTWQSKVDNPRGTFPAFTEKGTTLTVNDASGTPCTVTTGFDHIEEMGVNAVQLLPVFDHDDEETEMTFNWGYNPLNFNVVEGGYSSDPYDGYVRMREFKNLILQLAKNNNHARTIMDVVYNHVASASNSNFNKIVPKYYFRYTDSWALYNGSGCGNEVKSEAPMMSRFIVDSLKWWASEYKIKGFRFDLMGLIDYKTILKAAEELYKIDPDIYLYGEGWTGDGSDAHINQDYYKTWGSNTWTIYNMLRRDTNQNGTEDRANMCYVGAFNDAARNALKGENDISRGDGFISLDGTKIGGRSNDVADMLLGFHRGIWETTGNPRQQVAYASCHDNYTLFDQLTYTLGNNGTNTYYPGITCAGVAAVECAILFSNSTAFIQGGEELFRSKVVTDPKDLALIEKEDGSYSDSEMIAGKRISHNSYNLSDGVNAFDYSRKVKIGNTDTKGYAKAIRDAVDIHKKLDRYALSQFKAWDNAGVPNSDRPINYWNNGDGSTSIAMKNGEYFFFITGLATTSIPFGAITSAQDVFVSNPYGEGYTRKATGIELGAATAVCLRVPN